jgi:hypothetical protein
MNIDKRLKTSVEKRGNEQKPGIANIFFPFLSKER